MEIPRKMYYGSFQRNISIQKDSGERGVGVRMGEKEKGTDDQYYTFRNYFFFFVGSQRLHPCIKKQEET